MHVKVTCKILNIAMDMMLQLLNEAFKMAIQVRQVFYIDDPSKSITNWKII